MSLALAERLLDSGRELPPDLVEEIRQAFLSALEAEIELNFN